MSLVNLVFSQNQLPHPVTLTAPGVASEPQGTGYASLTISSLGAVKLVGRLGDGTAYTAGSHLTHDATRALQEHKKHSKGMVMRQAGILRRSRGANRFAVSAA